MLDITKAKPKIPAQSVLSLDVFGKEAFKCPTVLDVGEVRLTVNARTAFALALRDASIGHGASVLIPAYHCPAMVSPVIWMGAEPIFYPICSDTSVDVNVLNKYIRSDTRALVAVHYFGFIQDLRPLRSFCDKHNLILIEDCAHTFFGNFEGRAVGSSGDYAIASIMKFLPIYEGGCIASSSRSLAGITMSSDGFFLQCKSALNSIEMACEYARLPWFNYLLEIKQWIWDWLKSGAKKNRSSSPLVDSVGELPAEGTIFDPSLLERKMSWSAIAIMKTMSVSRAYARRRANYITLLNALGNIAGGRPLFGRLPENVCPQVFPMLVDAPSEVFPVLKKMGVPIIRFGEYRWNGVDGAICPVSDKLSRHVFQFPCHQSLTKEELEWMIRSIIAALQGKENVSSNVKGEF